MARVPQAGGGVGACRGSPAPTAAVAAEPRQHGGMILKSVRRLEAESAVKEEEEAFYSGAVERKVGAGLAVQAVHTV